MPTPFAAEFRADVIAVARKGEAPLRQIAKDFGISEACLHRWLKIADRQDGLDRPGLRQRRRMSPRSCAKHTSGSNSSSKRPR